MEEKLKKYFKRIEKITGKPRVKTTIPLKFEMIGENRNWKFFLNKG